MTPRIEIEGAVMQGKPVMRKIVYTTNAVESLHMTLRKVTKNRDSFPRQEAAIKLIYLALQNVSPKMAVRTGLARRPLSVHDPLA
jgi:transposase-like protein